ncbi:MAG: hypothetical protein K6G17_02960 [Oscillospiraceae bacterium]|nr:hypothetical protein [Oscillospiraceae bacterium]
MRAIRWPVLAIVMMLLITSCSRTDKETAQIDIDNMLADQSESYMISERKNNYYITIYDSKHTPFEELGPFSKEPEIKQVDEETILVSVQAGSGKETKWGIYYDIVEHRQSEPFYGILAETHNTVAFCGSSQIIIQDIYDASAFRQVISDFPTTFSPTATPFISASFTNNNSEVMIEYFSGDDYHTEVVTIPLDNSR